MSIERELTELFGRVIEEREESTRLVTQQLIDEVRKLQVAVGSADARALASTSAEEANSRDILDRISYLENEQGRQRALLLQILERLASSSQGREAAQSAHRTLISAHDQLGLIEAADSAHQDVIAGQRKNIQQSLEQLGIIPSMPAFGSRFDPSQMRSESETISTQNEALNDRVATVTSLGWVFADGSGALRLPQVKLHEFHAMPDPNDSATSQGICGTNHEDHDIPCFDTASSHPQPNPERPTGFVVRSGISQPDAPWDPSHQSIPEVSHDVETRRARRLTEGD